MERGETGVTHLSTFTYRQAHATIFLRFRVREAGFLDISMLLIRSFQPFGGARASPDGDSVDIAGGGMPGRLGRTTSSVGRPELGPG
jgi:hypothetical protein